MENLKSRTDVRILRNEKVYLKWKSKPSYMLQKTFDNNLVAILKNKVTLTLLLSDLCKILITNSIMIKLKINMITTQDYYSPTLIV